MSVWRRDYQRGLPKGSFLIYCFDRLASAWACLEIEMTIFLVQAFSWLFSCGWLLMNPNRCCAKLLQNRLSIFTKPNCSKVLDKNLVFWGNFGRKKADSFYYVKYLATLVMSATNLFGLFWYEVGNLPFYKNKMDKLRPPYPLFASLCIWNPS